MFYCDECGEPNVQGVGWYTLNTGILTGDEGPIDDVWCPFCDDHTWVGIDGDPDDPWRHVND